MLPAITLPTGRTTTQVGFGCATMMGLPEARDRQRLLDLDEDLCLRHFDAAHFQGLGQVEAHLARFLLSHRSELT